MHSSVNKRITYSLKYLNENQLVKGLPTIIKIQPCKACVIRKQAHHLFPKCKQIEHQLH